MGVFGLLLAGGEFFDGVKVVNAVMTSVCFFLVWRAQKGRVKSIVCIKDVMFFQTFSGELIPFQFSKEWSRKKVENFSPKEQRFKGLNIYTIWLARIPRYSQYSQGAGALGSL